MKNELGTHDWEVATSRMRKAVYASLVIAIFALAAIAYSLFEYGWQSVDVMDYMDFFLMCGLAYGIHRRSMFFAIAALLYYMVTRAVHLITTPYGQGSYVMLVVTVFFLYYFVQGVRGAFFLRRWADEG